MTLKFPLRFIWCQAIWAHQFHDASLMSHRFQASPCFPVLHATQVARVKSVQALSAFTNPWVGKQIIPTFSRFMYMLGRYVLASKGYCDTPKQVITMDRPNRLFQWAIIHASTHKKDMNSAHTQVKQIWLTDADFLLAELQCAFISKGLHFKCSSCQQMQWRLGPTLVVKSLSGIDHLVSSDFRS